MTTATVPAPNTPRPTQQVTYTAEQLDAMAAVEDALNRDGEAVLTGCAGTGKTTCLRELARRTKAVLATPTGKAARVLTAKAGREAATLHSLLYTGADQDDDSDELTWGEPKAPCDPGGTLIVDEASMVGRDLYVDVKAALPPGARVLWVGDPEQLEPVKDDWGPSLRQPTAHLTTVHRQAADNPIVAYATAIREGRGAAWRRAWDASDPRVQFVDVRNVDAIVEWAAAHHADDLDWSLITFTHRTRQALNNGVRRRLGLEGELARGDRIVCRMNSREIGIMNGEVADVVDVRQGAIGKHPTWRVMLDGYGEQCRILRNLFNDRSPDVWRVRKKLGDRWNAKRCLHAWHGFALTIHSSQGSQWDHVGFVIDGATVRMGRKDREAARRLAYTAVTRAAERLTVFTVGGAL